MDLYLQQGDRMMGMCRDLIRHWGRGTVIISPRDISSTQIPKFAKEIYNLKGDTLLDPQLYLPRADHVRLNSHPYWPKDFETGLWFNRPQLDTLLHAIGELNDVARTRAYILPGVYCERVDEDWCSLGNCIVDSARQVLDDKPRLATLSLSAETIRFEEQIEDVLAITENWNVEGYYLVAEHPNGDYLVDDVVWLANLLLLASGLKLQGKEVVVGYANHQMLCLSSCKVDAIASGNHLNVRRFPPDKFWRSNDDNISRRTRWYYCPQALSEYKLAFLDFARRVDMLNALQPDGSLDSPFCQVLFSGAQPSTTNYTETKSFLHYLHCLHEQAGDATRASFEETLSEQELSLVTAERLLTELHRRGVRGQNRDFSDCVDVNRAALSLLQESRGFVMERRWPDL